MNTFFLRGWPALVCLSLLAGLSRAATIPDPLPLWPNGAPGAEGDEAADRPELRVYLPANKKAAGTGIVICPGGGYGALASDHEGHQVAKWLNSLGVAGFVLKYRHSPKYRHPAPLQDAQRALRFVRHHSKKWKISPQQIGIMGFSAGGHLASTAATHFDAGDSENQDPVERLSCRPNFAILGYPVISLSESYAHAGSRRNLLGADPDPQLVDELSNEKQVTPETPPVFLFHTAEDPAVPVENSLAFFAACREAGVPAEMHIYQFGPHGVGLAPADPVTSTWTDRLADWLQGNGFLSQFERAAVEGTVRVNGKPLRWGMISFTASEGPHKPVAFALVMSGQFRIPAERGPVVGTCRIGLYNLGSVEPQPTIDDSQQLDNNALQCEIKNEANRIVVELGR